MRNYRGDVGLIVSVVRRDSRWMELQVRDGCGDDRQSSMAAGVRLGLCMSFTHVVFFMACPVLGLKRSVADGACNLIPDLTVVFSWET